MRTCAWPPEQDQQARISDIGIDHRSIVSVNVLMGAAEWVKWLNVVRQSGGALQLLTSGYESSKGTRLPHALPCLKLGGVMA
jgi:hypothetical protein